MIDKTESAALKEAINEAKRFVCFAEDALKSSQIQEQFDLQRAEDKTRTGRWSDYKSFRVRQKYSAAKKQSSLLSLALLKVRRNGQETK